MSARAREQRRMEKAPQQTDDDRSTASIFTSVDRQMEEWLLDMINPVRSRGSPTFQGQMMNSLQSAMNLLSPEVRAKCEQSCSRKIYIKLNGCSQRK